MATVGESCTLVLVFYAANVINVNVVGRLVGGDGKCSSEGTLASGCFVCALIPERDWGVSYCAVAPQHPHTRIRGSFCAYNFEYN